MSRNAAALPSLLCSVCIISESLATVPQHNSPPRRSPLTTTATAAAAGVTPPCARAPSASFNDGAVAVTSPVSGALAGGWQAAGERSVGAAELSGAETWGSCRNLTSLSPTTRWFTDRGSPSAEPSRSEPAARYSTKVNNTEHISLLPVRVSMSPPPPPAADPVFRPEQLSRTAAPRGSRGSGLLFG